MTEVTASGFLDHIPKNIDDILKLLHIPSRIQILNNLNTSLTLAPDGGSSGADWPVNIKPREIADVKLTPEAIVSLAFHSGLGVYTTRPEDPRVDSNEDPTEIVVSLTFVALQLVKQFLGYGGTTDSDKVRIITELQDISIDRTSTFLFIVAPAK